MSAECSRRDGGCYPDMNEALHACDKLLARGMGAGIIGLLVHAGARARSSVGQSGGLIILWSQVRALPGPCLRNPPKDAQNSNEKDVCGTLRFRARPHQVRAACFCILAFP